MYSAGVGETALNRLPGDDPDKRNSVYTRKLAQTIQAIEIIAAGEGNRTLDTQLGKSPPDG
jgi:hypothetical protein